jgi:uncharacterized protein YndB with AHSA1/START domain
VKFKARRKSVLANAVNTKPATDVADRELVFTRLLDAPRELVFKVWTDPAHLIQWYGPKGFVTSVYEMDVRPGGVWRLTMRGPDGVDYKNRIVFLDVVKPERLVYKHEPEEGSEPVTFETTVTFGNEQGKTRLTLRMLFPSLEEREYVVKKHGAVEGCHQMFGKLTEYLRTMAPNAHAPLPEVNITRLFDAPRKLVFQAWTDAERMKHWWGPNGFTTLLCELDPRPGGAIRIDMRSPDGMVYHRGTVREIVPPERLVLAMNVEDQQGNIIHEGVTIVTFAEEFGKTRLTVHARIERSTVEHTPTDAARMEDSWNQILDHLAKDMSESKEHLS